jgi:hypothetical protein
MNPNDRFGPVAASQNYGLEGLVSAKSGRSILEKVNRQCHHSQGALAPGPHYP